MRRLGLLMLCSLVVLIFGSSWVVADQKAGKSEDSLTVPLGAIELSAPEGVETKKTSVEFPHARHFGYSCQTCHHSWDFGPEVSGCMTSGCHDLIKAPKKSEKVSAVMYYKKAFHQKCISCHREIKKQNLAMEKKIVAGSDKIKLQNTGPTGCRECHPK